MDWLDLVAYCGQLARRAGTMSDTES